LSLNLIEENLKYINQFDFDSKEISAERAREILGSKADGLNDEELQIVINMVMTMAEVAVNDFFNKKVPEDEKKLYNLTAYQSKKTKNSKRNSH
jgi:hypothetical protein